VRNSEFWELVDREFGVRGRMIVREHVLTALGGRTAAEALARGVDARPVWFALCEDFEVPEERRWVGDQAAPRRRNA
jgi:hypothetical protein